jgi:hypothetical protein
MTGCHKCPARGKAFVSEQRSEGALRKRDSSACGLSMTVMTVRIDSDVFCHVRQMQCRFLQLITRPRRNRTYLRAMILSALRFPSLILAPQTE